MRQKNTVYSPEVHNQFQESSEKINNERAKENESWMKDQKQGQSEFRKKKQTEKRV